MRINRHVWRIPIVKWIIELDLYDEINKPRLAYVYLLTKMRRYVSNRFTILHDLNSNVFSLFFLARNSFRLTLIILNYSYAVSRSCDDDLCLWVKLKYHARLCPPPWERANPWAVFLTRELLISTCNYTSQNLHIFLFFLHSTSLAVQMSVESVVVQALEPLLVVAPPSAPVLAPPDGYLLLPQVVHQDLDPHSL